MCFSASVSYGAAAVLVTTGLYAAHQASRLRQPYWVIGLAPLFFGIQQAFEGRVWQMVEAGGAAGAVPYALGFLFFSHFLWLWWIPLSSYVVEPERNRKKVFLGTTLFGLLAGTLVYSTLLVIPNLVSVVAEEHHIIYDVSSPYRGPISIGIPPSALYALIILIPLLFSSHRHIRIFGGLVVCSVVLASVAYGYAFVSVWCFFAAVLSLYLVYMIHQQTIGDTAKKIRLPHNI
jgi:hypothetical protein